ncbi:MAG: thioredoxin family protein [Candidatus Thorarchaeota archaeon]|nr:thioredoxin family protein [Candidatus Thorarchaeota archaeon]
MVVEFDEETKEKVREMFAALDHDVTMHVFIRDHSCLYCNDTLAIAQEVADLSPKIHAKVHRGELNTETAARLGVKLTPAIVLHGKEQYKVRFYGIPAGHEFGALIGSIVDVSAGVVPLPPDVIEDIKAIDRPVRIKVFTTPQCPYCPGMVRLAHQSAIVNPLIEADMVEALEFQELAAKHQVYGVPKTVFNESVSVEGLTPPEIFVEKLYDAVGK